MPNAALLHQGARGCFPSLNPIEAPQDPFGELGLCPPKEAGVTLMPGKSDGEAASGWLPPFGKTKGAFLFPLASCRLPWTIFKIFLSGGQSGEER